jgi:hypothetical protein
MRTKEFSKSCRFRYNEFRTGDTRKGAGEHTIYDRCLLIKTGNTKCIFMDCTHQDCPLSTEKKHKVKGGTARFKGKWKKTKL